VTVAPSARIVHQVPGRTRLRTREMKGDDKYFAELHQALSQTPGVRNVQVNSLTQSILLEHDTDIQELMSEAERRGYLRLESPAHQPYLAEIDRVLSVSDHKLREVTGGRLDFETLTFLGFAAGGLYQVVKGRALPAGVTLLRYAVELVGSAGLASLERRAQAGRAYMSAGEPSAPAQQQ
jgi:heavy-metal-associated domain-containing protein